MAAAVARHLEALEGKRTPQNMMRERSRSRCVTDYPIAQTRADLVRRRDVAPWMDALSADKGGRTINRCLSFASKAWLWAYDHGYVPEDRPNHFRLVARAPEPNLDKDHLSRDEAREIVKAARTATDEGYADMVAMDLNTGARRGELQTLTWPDVDLKGRIITIRAKNEKAGGGRRVDLTPEAVEILTRRRESASPWRPDVFTNSQGRPFSDDMLRNRMNTLRNALKGNANIAPHKLLNLKFKDFRDAFVCWLLEAGTPTATVARIVGHRHLVTTEKPQRAPPGPARRHRSARRATVRDLTGRRKKGRFLSTPPSSFLLPATPW